MTVIDVPRGLSGVAVAETSVGDVRGEEGFYHYHEYDATTLARSRTFEDVWRMLIDGSLPNEAERTAFVAETASLRPLSGAVGAVVAAAAGLGAPDAELRTAMAAVGADRQMRPVVDLDVGERRADGLALAASVPTAIAGLHRHRLGLAPVASDPSRGAVADYLHQLTGV